MPVSTYITKPDNQHNRKLLDWREILLFVALAVCVYFDQFVLVFIGLFMFIIFNDFFRVKEYQRKGAERALGETLVFETDKITVGTFQFDLELLSNLTITALEYEGQRVRVGRGYVIRKGLRNTLEFAMNEKTYNFTFYIQSELMKAELGDLIKEWYRYGFAFKESDENGKTYGLKQLNYKQIQEFKRSIKENKTDSY